MQKETRRVLLQIGLFIITFITTTLAGTEWAYGRSIFVPGYTWDDFTKGFSFSVPLLLILTVHEFGHYFTAMYHKVKASLPYYIPIPPIPFLPLFSIGTFGAVIRLRSRPYSNLQNFDIGLAGPLAGFVVAVALLIYGFSTLPPVEYVFQFHPEYEQFGANYAEHVYTAEYMKEHKGVVDVQIGKNLLFLIAEQFVDDPSRIPNAHELMHYPLLMAVLIALFVTSLNLLPIGQLDGGHVVYGLFGFKKHRIIASVFFIAIMFYAGINNPYIQLSLPKGELLLNTILYVFFLYFSFLGLGLKRRDTIMCALIIVAIQFLMMIMVPEVEGYSGWLLLGFLLGRFIGVHHPPSEIEQPLDAKRITLGWFTLLIFVLCFTPMPISVEVFIEQ
ncbi:site-2 protease family protein [Chryseosolibacter indicus]|uniref:Site-2 protease family protein n=1 Tax=Chryseosolibacter indicus TaxID=2782351 RepID=A0ABS5VU90_9BACT|nr:site-2 protease family protein [Chryseosolibacter indicus]MBT1703561.1 site-2 protease family protein [Chryseosolibacter indicus]